MYLLPGDHGMWELESSEACSLSPWIFIESESSEIQTLDALPQMLLTHKVGGSPKVHCGGFGFRANTIHYGYPSPFSYF